jgi:hypothetical protein
VIIQKTTINGFNNNGLYLLGFSPIFTNDINKQILKQKMSVIAKHQRPIEKKRRYYRQQSQLLVSLSLLLQKVMRLCDGEINFDENVVVRNMVTIDAHHNGFVFKMRP